MWLDHLLSREINGSIMHSKPFIPRSIPLKIYLFCQIYQIYSGIKINRYLLFKNICVILISAFSWLYFENCIDNISVSWQNLMISQMRKNQCIYTVNQWYKTNWFSVQVKLQRAYGECLGTDSRWRTCKAAISHGEVLKSLDPWNSEWGNPLRFIP